MQTDQLREMRNAISDDLSIKDLRLILGRHCIRMLLTESSQSLDTSTDWGFRLLQSILVLLDGQSLMGRNSEKRTLLGLQKSIASALKGRTAGGVLFKLETTGVVSNLTYALNDLLLERLNPSKKRLEKTLEATLIPTSYSAASEPHVSGMIHSHISSLSADVDTILDERENLRGCPLFFHNGKYDADIYSQENPVYGVIPEDLAGYKFWREWLHGKVIGNKGGSPDAKAVAKIAYFGDISKDRKMEIGRQLEIVSFRGDLKVEETVSHLGNGAASGGINQLGSEKELAARKVVLEQIAALESNLPKPMSHGGIGHNHPPKDLELHGHRLKEVREGIDAIGSEMTADRPNPKVVAEKTSLLVNAIGWVASKIDTTVEEFCKSFGKGLGVTASIGIPAVILSSTYWGKMAELFDSLKNWLSIVLG